MDNYTDDSLSEIEQSFRELRDGCLSGIPVAPAELAVFENMRRLFRPTQRPESWRTDPVLLTRLQAALQRHGSAAHELKIFLAEWYLNEQDLKHDADGLARAHRLIAEGCHRRCELGDGSTADFERAISHYRTALDHYEAIECMGEVAAIRHQLARLYDLQGDRETACGEFSRALAAFPKDGNRQEWIETQNDFAMTILKGDEPEAPEEAIRRLKLAVSEMNNLELPRLHCALVEGLGIAYQYRICGDQSENLRIATQYFSDAMNRFAAAGDEDGRARMLAALGAVWVSRTNLGESDYSQAAIDCSRLAQAYYKRHTNPYRWANLEYQMGSALIAGSNSANLDSRIAASLHFRNAIEVYEMLQKAPLARSVREILNVNEQAVDLLQSKAC